MSSESFCFLPHDLLSLFFTSLAFFTVLFIKLTSLPSTCYRYHAGLWDTVHAWESLNASLPFSLFSLGSSSFPRTAPCAPLLIQTRAHCTAFLFLPGLKSQWLVVFSGFVSTELLWISGTKSMQGCRPYTNTFSPLVLSLVQHSLRCLWFCLYASAQLHTWCSHCSFTICLSAELWINANLSSGSFTANKVSALWTPVVPCGLGTGVSWKLPTRNSCCKVGPLTRNSAF